MDFGKMSLELHEKMRGKIEVISKVNLADRVDLSLAYTPGVAEPCKKIAENPDDAYKYTSKEMCIRDRYYGTICTDGESTKISGIKPNFNGTRI